MSSCRWKKVYSIFKLGTTVLAFKIPWQFTDSSDEGVCGEPWSPTAWKVVELLKSNLHFILILFYYYYFLHISFVLLLILFSFMFAFFSFRHCLKFSFFSSSFSLRFLSHIFNCIIFFFIVFLSFFFRFISVSICCPLYSYYPGLCQ